MHTKEIDLVNRDPKHLNDDVVKVRGTRRDGTGRGVMPFLGSCLSCRRRVRGHCQGDRSRRNVSLHLLQEGKDRGAFRKLSFFKERGGAGERRAALQVSSVELLAETGRILPRAARALPAGSGPGWGAQPAAALRNKGRPGAELLQRCAGRSALQLERRSRD